MDIPIQDTIECGDKDRAVEPTQGAERPEPARPFQHGGYGGLEDAGGSYGAWI